MKTCTLRERIASILPELVSIRHELHRHPELCYQEVRTSTRVCQELDAMGVAYKAGVAETGIIAHLPAVGEGDGSENRATEDRAPGAVALRADMDGLPITECTDKPYTSETPGLMHACGHDGHTAMLLGAIRVLSRLAERPNPVTFFFQPAEEGGAGGKRMCDEGCLLGKAGGGLGPRVVRVFGLHGWPTMPVGQVATRPGALLAATNDFIVRVCSTGGHAAYPHQTADPVLTAAQIVCALQSIVSRNIEPTEPIVITVARIAGGAANNVIPTTVELGGTVRTISSQTRRYVHERFLQVVEQTAAAMGCHVEIDWREGYPVTHNDPGLTERFFAVACKALGAERVEQTEHPTLGGEDFSYYGQHVPACFFLLGLLPKGADPATTPKLHQADFDFNDDAIPTGVETLCRLALAPA